MKFLPALFTHAVCGALISGRTTAKSLVAWQRNRSILWAILAGIISWNYVIYFAPTRRPDEMID
jgi:hypothetical protein